MSSEGIEWETIPPRTSHFGCLWDPSIKSMKRLLRRTVGLQILSFEEQITIELRIGAAMSKDPNDLQPITCPFFVWTSNF